MGNIRFSEKFQNFLCKLSQPDSSCPQIALSFSLGTLIAILPTPGFGIFIGLSLLVLFKSLNKIAMVLAITVWNPFLQIPLYFASYRLGCLLLGQSAAYEAEIPWLTLLTESTQAFMLGNSILGFVVSSASYFIVFRMTQLHRQKKAVRELLKVYQLADNRQKSF